MGERDDILNKILNEDFIKDFLGNCDGQKRLNISIISSVCLELANASDEECTAEFRLSCAEKILKQCSQMMKFSDIFTAIANIMNGNELPEDIIDVTEFLSEFTSECKTYLKDICKIHYTPGSHVITEAVKDLLEFCLVMYVRKSVLNGAESITLTHTLDKGYIVIHAEIKKFGKTAEPENMPETFTIDYADDIVSFIISKIEGKFTVNDREMKLYIPLKSNGNSVLNSSFKTCGKSFFNVFKNMLSDLCDITNI